MIFNRYWISGRGGHGWEQWKYFEGDFNGDKEDAWYEILHSRETWAVHCEYSFDIELDVIPPKEFVENKIANAAEAILRSQKYLEDIKTYYQGMK
ncbi:hypothetical protein [Xanthomonas phage BUDD]|nr:hypothetical protein [Xanthomonas phage BUDD]